jgi:predicted N-acyltransferase
VAGTYYLLNQNGFEEACEGFNYKQVQAELFNQGFLIKSDDQFKFKHNGHFSFQDNEGRRYYPPTLSGVEC